MPVQAKGRGTAMTMSRIATALIALMLIASAATRADEWPSRTIRFIVPFAAGGSTDIGARLIANVLSRALHQQVVVEDRSGADGNIGMEAATKGAPSGQTALVTSGEM